MNYNKTSFHHPLMSDNFKKSDFLQVSNLLKKTDILTQSKKVSEFESKWSNWLGVKHSVFVNSGSSANYLSMRLLKIVYGNNYEIIVPSLTWISDIVSVIDHGFKPVFVDIDLKNLSASTDEILKKINKKTLAVFLTHAQGFNSLTQKLLNVLKTKNILLIEDVCESHGALYKKKKLGSFGSISNFSFYYAHHMSTIEGGMICTNNSTHYQILRALRSHGMVREMNDENLKNNIINENRHLSPQFIFKYPGLNFRNNEISAVIGINQLKRLDKNIEKRRNNFKFFLKLLNKDIFFTNYDLKGNSNYAFPLILLKKSILLRNKLEKIMSDNNIEYRKGNAGGGNQLLQPYLSNFKKTQYNKKKFQNVDHVHNFGYYIGNYPELKKTKIIMLAKILNSIVEL